MRTRKKLKDDRGVDALTHHRTAFHTKIFIKTAVFLLILICCSSQLMAAEKHPVKLYAPDVPASLPVILAAESLTDVEVKIFENHSQAHSLFLKGDGQMLVTGLSVGIRLFRQGIPVKMVNSYVSGMTYLVTDRPAASFAGLKGISLYLPFRGSPIEEITEFFIRKEGLDPQKDFRTAYLMFPGTAALLQQGSISAAVLPEPFVSQVLEKKPLLSAVAYKNLWEKHTGLPGGYPQVGTFVNREWAASNTDVVRRLNHALARSIKFISEHPEAAVEKAALRMGYPPALLTEALQRTDFRFLEKEDLKNEIIRYYRILGSPVDENLSTFF